MLYIKRFSLKIKRTVCRIYVRLAMLYGSETRCINENNRGHDVTTVRDEVDKRETMDFDWHASVCPKK